VIHKFMFGPLSLGVVVLVVAGCSNPAAEAPDPTIEPLYFPHPLEFDAALSALGDNSRVIDLFGSYEGALSAAYYGNSCTGSERGSSPGYRQYVGEFRSRDEIVGGKNMLEIWLKKES